MNQTLAQRKTLHRYNAECCAKQAREWLGISLWAEIRGKAHSASIAAQWANEYARQESKQ